MGAPADAIREFLKALEELNISARSGNIKDDISALRLAFREDADFAKALGAIAARLADLAGGGSELDHDLSGWWRVKFPSGSAESSNLRIIFRPDAAGFELRAFGHRHSPESVYRRAAQRRGKESK